MRLEMGHIILVEKMIHNIGCMRSLVAPDLIRMVDEDLGR